MEEICYHCDNNPIDQPGIYCKECLEEAIEWYGRWMDQQLQEKGKSPEALFGE